LSSHSPPTLDLDLDSNVMAHARLRLPRVGVHRWPVNRVYANANTNNSKAQPSL
jgi:hypothetical protein